MKPSQTEESRQVGLEPSDAATTPAEAATLVAH
jgi:hypothetical protein